jgi:hypothetical protein
MAGVVALLSPGTSWEHNIADAAAMLWARAYGQGINEFNVTTYGTMKWQAWDFLDDPDPENIKGRKVSRFFMALGGRTDIMCVDRWMLRIWNGSLDPEDDFNVSDLQYEDIERDLLAAAKLANIEPTYFQATTWLVARRLAGHTNHEIMEREELPI